MKIKSCIITPTWNNEEYTIRCFDSIRKNTKDYLLIWIDNGSNSESRQKVKDFLDEKKVPYELIANEENLGFVKATNQGMRRAIELGVDYIILENNDTEVYEGWLDRMIEVARDDEKIGLVGPITSPCASWQSIDNLRKNLARDFFDLPEYKNNPLGYSKIIKQKYEKKYIESEVQLAFFCVLIKKEVIEEYGYLSEEFGVGFGDDDDYCMRVMKAGWKLVIAKDVFVFHNHRTTFKSIYSDDKIDEMLSKNAKKISEKHGDFFKLKQKIVNLESRLDDARRVILSRDIEIARIKNSKLFLVSDLFNRAAGNPYKILMFPMNMIRIIFRKAKNGN